MKSSLIFCLLIVRYAYSANPLLFSPSLNMGDEDVQDIHDIMNIVMRPREPERFLPDEYFLHFGRNPHTRLTAFSFTNCGDPATETLRLLQLKVTPDPIVLPGKIGVSFVLQNLAKDVAPVQIDLTLKKKILGLWIEIPCIDNVGSCSYPDACELLAQLDCPQPLKDNKIPCECPIPVGNYTLPETTFPVEVSSIPTGDYQATINIALSSGSKACYQIDATLG